MNLILHDLGSLMVCTWALDVEVPGLIPVGPIWEINSDLGGPGNAPE